MVGWHVDQKKIDKAKEACRVFVETGTPRSFEDFKDAEHELTTPEYMTYRRQLIEEFHDRG